jgi:hypothetical protein
MNPGRSDIDGPAQRRAGGALRISSALPVGASRLMQNQPLLA